MQTATCETQSKSLDLSICVHHYTLRAPCPKGQGNSGMSNIFENICRVITLRSINGYLLDIWSNNSKDDGTDRPRIAWSEARRQSGGGPWDHSGSNFADRMTTARRQQHRCGNRFGRSTSDGYYMRAKDVFWPWDNS